MRTADPELSAGLESIAPRGAALNRDARSMRIMGEMGDTSATCWTTIRGAAAGNQSAREEFARRYIPVVRAYLGARWRKSPLSSQIDDATQEVFLACFKEGGALQAVDSERGAFRGFLYGIARNIARQTEARRGRTQARRDTLPGGPDDLVADQDGFSSVFDRAWAKAIMKEATDLQATRAEGDERATRRHDLLRLRFQESLPIREIAARWKVDATELHREYPRARRDFRDALLAVMGFHHPGSKERIEKECARLLSILA